MLNVKMLPTVFVVMLAIAMGIFYSAESKNNVSVNAKLTDQEILDLDRCKNFENQEDREICETSAIYEMIFLTDDISYCEKLPKDDDRQNCPLKSIIHSIKMGATLDLCNQLDDNVAEDCRYNIVLQDINYGGDESLCDQLVKKSNIKVCKQRSKDHKKKFAEYTTILRNAYETTAGIFKSDTNAVFASDVETFSNDESVVYEKDTIKIYELQHFARKSETQKNFYQIEGNEVGLDVNTYTSLDFKVPFDQGKGVASGDFDNDGWVDLVYPTKRGIHLYKNTSHNSFVRIAFDMPAINDLDVFLVALVDINNDGWLDLYISGYGGGQYFVLNDQNSFDEAEIISIEADDRILSQAVSFADIDQDGDLDFYQGYLGHSRHANRRWEQSENHLVLNNNLNFEFISLEEKAGETLTVLFSDINDDGKPDILVGNDFEGPDAVLMGQGGASFIPIVKQDNIIPVTPYYNMSYDTGDVNNDLITDIFSVDLGDISSYSAHQVNKDYCLPILSRDERRKCDLVLSVFEAVGALDAEQCLDVEDALTKNQCLLAVLVKIAEDTRNSELCNKIPNRYVSQQVYCKSVSLLATQDYLLQLPEELNQERLNSLLIGTGNGEFKSMAEEFGVIDSHWSWTGKFADLDNDEWQDIYVGNGYSFDRHLYTSNIFFHNEKGQGFSKKQEEFGLTNYLHTPGYTYIDIDNDGDLDIATNSTNAPAVIFINNENKNNSITLEFRDKKGNFFGIGTKVYIYYEGGQQMRELKSGGGYASFDAPLMHFGLGQYEKIDKMVIKWSTGEETIIEEDLSTNRKYIIARER